MARKNKHAGKPVIPQTRFASWTDFKTRFNTVLFGDQPFERGRYIFRGHREEGWKLEATFDRMFARLKHDRFNVARQMVESFKRSLEGLDYSAEVRNHEPAVLALGQHYGLPTRLLDWTESPYVALFFAFNNSVLWGAKKGEHVALWVLDQRDPIWQPENGVEIVEVPQVANKRIRNQAGKFTLLKTPFTTLEDFVVANRMENHALQQLLVPAKDALLAMSDLDAMGIHHATVYPEVEGAAQMAMFRAVVKLNTALATSSTPRPA